MLARTMIAAAALALAMPAQGQPTEVRPISGTRLDVVAAGEVTRVPDIVLINAGISTQAATASEAIRTNGAAMDRMRAALRTAGIAPRDIQTSSVNLNPEWRHRPNAAPLFAGYTASHTLSVRFRDPAHAGRILDALVAAGANQIDGPSFEVAEPAAALDEARTRALAAARARADLYATALGMRVRRILAVSESGLVRPRGMAMREQVAGVSGTNIDLGEESLGVSLTVSFELE